MKDSFIFPCKTHIWRRGVAPNSPKLNVFIFETAITFEILDGFSKFLAEIMTKSSTFLFHEIFSKIIAFNFSQNFVIFFEMGVRRKNPKNIAKIRNF